DALSERRDLRAAGGEQTGARSALPRDGHHGFHTHLPREGSCAGHQPDLRGHRRDRRHADARRAVLRRRDPHELAHHAESSTPNPVHRQHPRLRREGRQDPVLSRRAASWRRNLFAITAASFIGFMGFTLVMPFLPLFIARLGVSDVGEVALWTGLSLGITPALTALMSPFWGRLADRYGRKIMVERSLVTFVIGMAATAYVTRAWQVLALRAAQGLFAGYGSLTLTMAAQSAPRDRMAQS